MYLLKRKSDYYLGLHCAPLADKDVVFLNSVHQAPSPALSVEEASRNIDSPGVGGAEGEARLQPPEGRLGLLLNSLSSPRSAIMLAGERSLSPA